MRKSGLLLLLLITFLLLFSACGAKDSDFFTGLETELSDDSGVFAQVKVRVDQAVYADLSPDAAASVSADLRGIVHQFILGWTEEQGMLHGGNANMTFLDRLDIDLVWQDRQYLSVVADLYVEAAGAAHQEVARYGYTYRVEEGSRLQLVDVWQGNTAPEQLIYEQLQQQETTGDYFPELDSLLAKYLQDGRWYLAGEEIYFLFQPYEIGPYSLGVQEFCLPMP